MQAMDDMALLRDYAANNSETAFAELVSRRVNFVYSAALRQVRDPHLAGEITQAVFIILAQKAGRISDKTILTGWFFRTTRFAALAQMRADAKRSLRTAIVEKELQMQTENSSAVSDGIWNQMSPLLDEALTALGEKDRQAVLLRFFENKSLAEVGNELGMGEDTARKRVSRALEKLHRYFAKRGISSTTAMIAGAISTHSIQTVPMTLTKSVSAMAVAKGSVAAGSTTTLVKGTLKMMTWAKIKFALGITSVILIAGGTITVALSEIGGKSSAAGSNDLQARIERSEFSARVVRYTYPPGISNPAVVVFSPRLAGLSFREPLLSAEFSWKSDGTHPPVNEIRLATADDQGNEFDLAGNNIIFGDEGTLADGRQYWATYAPMFPRRGKTIHLRLIANENQTLADLAIPNPARGSYPVWQAQPLPVSVETNGLEVTLEKFRSLQTVTNEDHTPRTECYFRFRENGRETFDWMPVLIQISDATSNHWVAPRSAKDPYLSRVEDGVTRSEFTGALGPGESAWKLHADLMRTANFPESDLLHVAHVQIPAADELAQPHTRYDFNGASIDLSAVIGKDVAWDRITRLNPERKRDCVTVQLSGQILSRNRQLTFVGATDDKGRELKLEVFRDPGTPDNERDVPFSFVFHPLDNASELNLTVAVSETRTVEFIAKPEQVNEKN
jgi:RNA polymerase sigma factor (sigma-70 family)